MPKGIYKRTPEHISQSIKNFKGGWQYWKNKKRPPFSEEWKKNIGKSPIGFKHLQTTKEKMSQIAKEKHFGKWMIGKKIPQETINKRIPKISGENHYNWKGGKSRDKHGGNKCIKWRLAIFERDNYTCQGCKKVGGYLEAHHIKSWAKYPKLRFNLNNGITLCRDCHKLTDTFTGRGRII